jgi:hypothetical protein
VFFFCGEISRGLAELKKGAAAQEFCFWKNHDLYEIAIFRHLASSLSPKHSGIPSQI